MAGRPLRRARMARRNPGFDVVKFASNGVDVSRIISSHDSLKAAQKAHAELVMRDGKLRRDHEDYGIVGG
jgi:hypothetical protein